MPGVALSGMTFVACSRVCMFSLFGCLALVGASAHAPTNFVVFFADDLGYNEMGKWGWASNGTIRTPNVDRLTDEGVRFTSWYSAFQVCSPSRASLQTGRMPRRMGIGMPPGASGNVVFTAEATLGIPDNETTLGERMGADFATMLVGKVRVHDAPCFHILHIA